MPAPRPPKPKNKRAPVSTQSLSKRLRKKKPKFVELGFFRISAWQFPTFAWQTATLSSALSGFTSEFGMGSGGSRSLWSPSKRVRSAMTANLRQAFYRLPWKSVTFDSRASKRQLNCSFLLQPPKPIGCYMVKPHGQLVHVSYAHYWTSTPCLSTSSSPTALQGT